MTRLVQEPSAAEIATIVADALSAHRGPPIQITDLQVRPEACSTHPLDRLRVTLDSGERLALVWKRLQPDSERKSGDLLADGNPREVLIYRRLLARSRFGAADLYASHYDAAEDRGWLLLEDVGDWSLDDAGTAEWRAAVRQLAQLHAAYHRREAELRALGCLGEHDSDYYLRIARTARRNLEIAGALNALARFDDLVTAFGAVAEYVGRQPRTLVHGDLFPSNVIVQPGPMIRLIDWEWAAIGVGAWDLARLLDGWGSDKPAFIAAYLDEFAVHAEALDPAAFARTFAMCEAVNAPWYLSRSVESCRDKDGVDRLLDDMAHDLARLDRDDIEDAR